jgi:hypothetical protein
MIAICQINVNLSLKCNLIFCNGVVFWITTKNAKCPCAINMTLITMM